ncbi:hypothetical protein HDV63DRAFT_337346 [Trichoderma sp. SZMC 28014]
MGREPCVCGRCITIFCFFPIWNFIDTRSFAEGWYRPSLTRRSYILFQSADTNRGYFSASEAAPCDYTDSDECDKEPFSNAEELTAAVEKITIAKNYTRTRITWNDNHRTKELNGISCRVYMNTSNNTALISLRSYASLKCTRGGNSRHPVFIYIYPEFIKAITVLNHP